MTKTKSTKRALLLSALSLLMCVSMLIGSTYAWFTDSVASGSNVIQFGNLDLEVQYTLDGKNWADLDGATDLFQKGLWEPGHTEVVALKIENKGSLALKYVASMNIFNEVVGTNKDGGDIVLSDILTVSSMPMDGGAIGAALAGTIFSSDNVAIWQGSSVKTGSFKAGNILANDNIVLAGEDAYVLIKVDMAETVGNEANHKGPGFEPSIEFGLTVLATQYTNENDSFGNQYDKDATYPAVISTATELQTALENGGSYILTNDVKADADTTITVPAGVTTTLDLNGKTLEFVTDDADKNDDGKITSADNEVAIDVRGTLTVKNGKITTKHTSDNFGWNACTEVFYVAFNGTLNVENATIENLGGSDMAYAIDVVNATNTTVNVKDSIIKSSYIPVRVFNNGSGMNNVTIENSTLEGVGRAFWVHIYSNKDNGGKGVKDYTLNLDIFGNNNTFNASNPDRIIEFGFDDEINFDADGNQI